MENLKVAVFDKLKWNDVIVAFKFEVRTKKSALVKVKPFNRQLFQLLSCSKCCPLARTHALSLGRAAEFKQSVIDNDQAIDCRQIIRRFRSSTSCMGDW